MSARKNDDGRLNAIRHPPRKLYITPKRLDSSWFVYQALERESPGEADYRNPPHAVLIEQACLPLLWASPAIPFTLRMIMVTRRPGNGIQK